MAPPGLPDLVAVAPNLARVLLNTDEFRVLMVDLRPEQVLPASTPTTWVIYPLNSYALEFGAARVNGNSSLAPTK